MGLPGTKAFPEKPFKTEMIQAKWAEHFPCPKCGYMVDTYRSVTSKSQVLVACPYDCGPYFMPYPKWYEFQDNYDPTPL